MIAEFRLPDLGEGLPEAELVQWLVAEGDTVALNQTIAEVETAKAVVELPSPFSGTVARLHAQPGELVGVGSVLIAFDVTTTDAPAVVPLAPIAAETAVPRAADSAAVSGAAPVHRQPNLVGYGAEIRAGGRPRRRARVAAGRRATDTAVLDAAPHDAIRGPAPHDAIDVRLERPRSTPPVRRLAKELGLDLALVAGTGPSGLITRADVQAFAGGAGATRTSPALPPSDVAASDAAARTTRTPIRGVRRATAEATVRSAFTAPHVTTFLTVDVTATTDLMASFQADRALEGHRIGILAIAAKAVCLALARTPSLNATWDAEHGEIVEHHYVGLGIAAATPRGLVVPVIRDADALTLVDLADAIGALAETARAGRTQPAEMTGGTFSITNVGVFGVDAGTPIINPGEAGILALGAVRRRPWEHHGEIALRDVLTLSLSFDHRLVDGEQGARFLTDVGGVLAEPGRAMLFG